MSPDPSGYVSEVGFDSTDVKKIAGSMAARYGAGGSVVVCLCFEHSYAVIKLIDDS